MAKVFEHKDKLGQDLKLGDVVVVPYTTRLTLVCTIDKMTEKMITVSPCGKSTHRRTYLKYPNEVVYIGDIPDTLLYMLKQ